MWATVESQHLLGPVSWRNSEEGYLGTTRILFLRWSRFFIDYHEILAIQLSQDHILVSLFSLSPNQGLSQLRVFLFLRKSRIVGVYVDWHSWFSPFGRLLLEIDSVFLLLHDPSQHQANQKHSETEAQSSERLSLGFTSHNHCQEHSQQKSCEITHCEEHAGGSSFGYGKPYLTS